MLVRVGLLDLFSCDSGWCIYVCVCVCVCVLWCVKLSPSVSHSPLEEQ